jgi:rhamnulose-1-phosphate aldolase
MNFLVNNKAIKGELERIAETAGYLWQKNWAECNGGNISVNLTKLAGNLNTNIPDSAIFKELPGDFSSISGNIFYVTGSGTRMRDVSKTPLEFGSIIRISQDGKKYITASDKSVLPTSELPSHLTIHEFLKNKGVENGIVLHTHPTELIAMTHCKPFLNPVQLTHTLWSMIPEARVIVPKGIGIVPYLLTGTMKLATATIKQLENHDVVLWEKHGVLAVGNDILHCFDVIDTLTKAAQIYLFSRTAGFEPQGLNNDQLNELADAFKLPL